MKSRTREALPSLKACEACDKRIMQTKISKVNNVVEYITTSNITYCNNPLYAVALAVSEQVAHKFSGKWIWNGFLKKVKEGMLFAAHELRANSIKAFSQM